MKILSIVCALAFLAFALSGCMSFGYVKHPLGPKVAAIFIYNGETLGGDYEAMSEFEWYDEHGATFSIVHKSSPPDMLSVYRLGWAKVKAKWSAFVDELNRWSAPIEAK